MAFVLTLTVQTAGKTVRLGAEPGQRPGEWVGFLAEREEAAELAARVAGLHQVRGPGSAGRLAASMTDLPDPVTAGGGGRLYGA